MLKGEIINGYTILQDFVVAGGMSKISFAKKGGKEYFIKEFLYPKYPEAGSPGSEKIKEQKRKACEEFQRHHKTLNEKIATKVSLGGNLVCAVDFFRSGTCYYKVTEKIDTTSVTCKEISELLLDNIVLIAKCVCHSLRILHSLNIVHGDLKPDNILIKSTSKAYSAKLIDFDDSYFSEFPPNKENLVGTPEYYSPEQAAYITDEDGIINKDTLTLKSDIFTLGIILCEYFTGEKPLFDKKYGNTWSAVNDGATLNFAKYIPENIVTMLGTMLQKNPKDRPTIDEVFNNLKLIKSDDIRSSSEVTKPISGGFLRGKGLKDSREILVEKKDTKDLDTKLRGKGLSNVKK